MMIKGLKIILNHLNKDSFVYDKIIFIILQTTKEKEKEKKEEILVNHQFKI